MADDKNKGGAAKKAAASPKANADEASKARDNANAPGVDAPEPKDTTNAAPGANEATGVAPAADVQEQRTEEQKAALDAAKAEGEGGAATPAEKGQQTRAAADVREQAAADAEARSEVVEVETGDPLAPNYTTDSGPVQEQRNKEAEARDAKAAESDEALSDEDKRLMAAAPGGARTALTDGREGSTTVTHTAGHPRPASGPLDAPVTGIENYAATDDDPDNRVYADEAGPRDVFEDTDAVKARYVDKDGNALDYDAIFDDADGNKTFVTSKVRVYESFIFPNTTTEGRRLAYAAGRRVPRGEAENVRNQISVHSPIV